MENKEPIPQSVIDALANVRKSGLTNMFAREMVIDLVADAGDDEAYEWLTENRQRFMDALVEMGKQVGMINE